MDFERVARELLVALRGRRSQVQWSRRLGYRSNVAYSWESGRRYPTAAETFRACRRAHIDIAEAISDFYGQPPPWLGTLDPCSPEAVARLLEDQRTGISITELTERTGLSRYSISRWLSGHTQPRLPDFLRLLEAASLRMVDFLAELVEPGALPSVAETWALLEARRRGAYELPWTQAILRALELSDYEALEVHEPGWIARRLGISEEEEGRCIGYLEATGQVHRLGGPGGRFVPETRAVDTRSRPAVGRRLKAHWARVAADRVEAGTPGQFSYNVFTCSRADFERIREAHLNYFFEMRSIVEGSTEDEVVAVVNVHLLALEDVPG